MPDLHTAPTPYADEETVDTDFVHHLVRGAELLQAGEPAQARGMLERALRLRPKNQRGQNLLALSYFKLGQYERAEQIYKALIEEHSKDPTLRVNLGLVHLKMHRTEEAILAFSSALDLDPKHLKAQNYLGLTYMQLRDYDRARDWFTRAGNTTMAEKMVALQQSPLRNVSEAGLQALDATAVPFTSAVEPTQGHGQWTAVEAAEAIPETPEPTAPDLASFSAAVRVDTKAKVPFAITPTMLTVEVQAELYMRVDGLVATFGTLELKPAFKRFRGRVTEKPFGEPGRRMMHASGSGRLWIGTGGRLFYALEIADEPSYFREEALFGFQESLLFENGRVPSKISGDLQLIHLRNRGRALLVSKHKPRAVDVTKEEPARVLVDVLIGWHGNITPRIIDMSGESGEKPVAGVELTGTGRVLIDAPA